MNAYIQQIYRERCEAAEAAVQNVRERHQDILDRWRRFATEGVLYTRAQREADSKALQEAEQQFRLVLESVYQLEDDARETNMLAEAFNQRMANASVEATIAALGGDSKE